MKKLFKFKFETLALVISTIATILCYSIYVSGEYDWRLKALLFFCGAMLLFSIFAYKGIKEFRQEVYKRW